MKTKELAALDRKLDFWTATKDQHDIDKHNAALVPDLLAALETLVTWGRAAQLGNSSRSKQWTMFETARAAIAKARGAA